MEENYYTLLGSKFPKNSRMIPPDSQDCLFIQAAPKNSHFSEMSASFPGEKTVPYKWEKKYTHLGYIAQQDILRRQLGSPQIFHTPSPRHNNKV